MVIEREDEHSRLSTANSQEVLLLIVLTMAAAALASR